jgi:hypothetical protein
MQQAKEEDKALGDKLTYTVGEVMKGILQR